MALGCASGYEGNTGIQVGKGQDEAKAGKTGKSGAAGQKDGKGRFGAQKPNLQPAAPGERGRG